MAKDYFDKLLAKKKPTPEDAGRVLLFEMVEFLRKDREGVSRISPDGITQYTRRAMANAIHTDEDCSTDPRASTLFYCYREAYHKMLFWPEVCGAHFTSGLWSLERLKNMAKTVLLSEQQYEHDRQQPVIMTKGQFKKLQKLENAERKRKLRLHDIVLDVLDYALDRHDLPKAVLTVFGIRISQDEVDATKPKSLRTLKHEPGWVKAIFQGEDLTPFNLLLRHRDIYSHAPLKPFDIYDDFPEVMRTILLFLKIMCHIEVADLFLSKKGNDRTLAMEWSSITMEDVLATPLRDIYKRQAIYLPGNIAIITKHTNAPDNGINKGEDVYSPAAPFWASNCFANCKDTVRNNTHTLIKNVFVELELVYRWHTMVQLCAETFHIPDLPKTLPVLGREQNFVEEYNNIVELLQAKFLWRLQKNDICRLDYEDLLQTFPTITLEKLKPRQQIVDGVRERLTPYTFVTEHLNFFEELGEH